MFVLLLGTPLAVVVAMTLARRVDPKHARSLVIGLACLAALLGWLALAWTVFGPTYEETTISLSSNGSAAAATATTQSLVDVGLSPLTAVIIVAEGACFGLLIVGALFRRTNDSRGNWLMLLATAPPFAVGLISFGLVAVLPAVVLAEMTVALAFLTPGVPSRAAMDPSGDESLS